VVVLGEPAGNGLFEVETAKMRSQRSAGEVADVDDPTHMGSERIKESELLVCGAERRFQVG
jgi:hypothetical protein